MKINKKILFFCSFISVCFGSEVGLDDLLSGVTQNNQILKSYNYQALSKEKELESQKRSFFPTIDVGATYVNNNRYNTFTPEETKNIYGVASLDLYDGGKKSALMKSKAFDYKASLYEKDAFSKSMTLDIIQRYFLIQKLQSNLIVLQMKSKELQYQIKRAKSFVKAGLMTNDDVDKFQASSDENDYNMENTIFAMDEQKEYIQTQTGIEFNSFRESSLAEPDTNIQFDDYENTKILDAKAKSIKEVGNSVGSVYVPQIKIQDTYYKYFYDDATIASSGGFLVNDKNVLTVSANWRIFDAGQISKQKEAYSLQSLALVEQKLNSKKEQKSSFELAKKRLKTTLAQIKSATSAVKSAESTYDIITQKYEAGLVDNVSYLDALNIKSSAMSRYKTALYDYEIAKSLFYYYAGKNPKEFIR
ncbi:MAG: TolC family protein [Sulfurovaceae bacterium]|nr:TolC family protein [Sulfurovaceae bacterium]MDD5548565.1 TolC family protein [Sulfurovaceae bacterium]